MKDDEIECLRKEIADAKDGLAEAEGRWAGALAIAEDCEREVNERKAEIRKMESELGREIADGLIAAELNRVNGQTP